MDTAVLFETFARPQYARQVFDQIKKAKPKKLYFYSNKARVDRPDEVRNNEEIRSWVKEVDWDCELHTFFREEYVDVYTSVRGAMDWVFAMERRARLLMNAAALSPSKRGNCAPLRYSARGLICIDMVNSFSFSALCAHNIPGNSHKPNAK